MRLRTTGMEFASEMVINAAKAKLKVDEVPIIYYPRGGESKLPIVSRRLAPSAVHADV